MGEVLSRYKGCMAHWLIGQLVIGSRLPSRILSSLTDVNALRSAHHCVAP
jgi:hypothetical protein